MSRSSSDARGLLGWRGQTFLHRDLQEQCLLRFLFYRDGKAVCTGCTPCVPHNPNPPGDPGP